MNPTRFEMMRSDPNCLWHGDGEVVENHTLLTIEDEGAGKYAVLSCSNIGFDDLAEFDDWVGKVRAAMATGLGVAL